jgi:hypothetical protein
MISTRRIKQIVSQFIADCEVFNAELIGDGNIHQTWSIESEQQKIILQQINHNVFSDIQSLMKNISLVTEYSALKAREKALDGWIVPELLPTLKGDNVYIENDGTIWRAYQKITHSTAFQKLSSSVQAEETGKALAFFYLSTEGFTSENLNTTLPNFHNTPHYFERFLNVVSNHKRIEDQTIVESIESILKEEELVYTLFNLNQRGDLPQRVIHGDPKISNFLFDSSTLKAKSLIDLDTMQANSILYDIGDCLRSACNPAGEDCIDPAVVCFHLDYAEKILRGFFTSGIELNEAEKTHIPLAVKTITLELAIRFLTDHLEGNPYFNVDYEFQNLDRAINQMALFKDIKMKEPNLIRLSKMTSS